MNPDALSNADPEAVDAMARATVFVLQADDAHAYAECRLVAASVMERHPGLADDPRALALVMVRHAADAALLILPVPRAD